MVGLLFAVQWWSISLCGRVYRGIVRTCVGVELCKPGAQSYSRSDTLVLSHVRWTHISTIIVAIASS